MVVDMGYWSKVFKRLIVLILTIIGLFLAFKLAVFYMPFLIAFIISLLIEPLIKFVNRKTSLTRRTSAIIVLVVVAGILTLGDLAQNDVDLGKQEVCTTISNICDCKTNKNDQ